MAKRIGFFADKKAVNDRLPIIQQTPPLTPPIIPTMPSSPVPPHPTVTYVYEINNSGYTKSYISPDLTINGEIFALCDTMGGQ
jgi:hypothetical protein